MSGKNIPKDWCRTGDVLLTTSSVKPTTAAIVTIINMSSQLGHVGMSGRNVYNMTKFGIEGLTKGMGVELAKKNIRVNSVAPTFVETPMVKNFFKNKEFKKLN